MRSLVNVELTPGQIHYSPPPSFYSLVYIKSSGLQLSATQKENLMVYTKHLDGGMIPGFGLERAMS